MLTSSVKTKLVAFTVCGLIATAYLATRYVGLDPFDRGYEITVALPDASGLFENGEVTYRGVPVGEIAALEATASGVTVTARIDADAPEIPAESTARVANRSSIGEQYLDLRADSSGGPALGPGDEVRPASTDATPPDLDALLRTGRDFVASVPQDDLGTVIDEAYDATQGASEHLRRLIETSHDYVKTADRNFLVTQQLIENSQTVLATQEQSSQHLKNFSADFALIARTLADSDADLRTLIANTPGSARQLDGLFEDVGTPLGVLLANLITPAQVFGVNAAGVEDALITLPEAMSVGWAVTGSKGISLSLAQNFFAPLPCTTGYGKTPVRRGTATGAGRPLNLEAGCTAGGRANVRGPGAAPKKKGATARVTSATSLADLMGGR